MTGPRKGLYPHPVGSAWQDQSTARHQADKDQGTRRPGLGGDYTHFQSDRPGRTSPPQDIKQTRTKIPDDRVLEGIIPTTNQTGLAAPVRRKRPSRQGPRYQMTGPGRGLYPLPVGPAWQHHSAARHQADKDQGTR